MEAFTLLDKISDGSAADLYRAQRADKAHVFIELSRDVVLQSPATKRNFLLEAQARQHFSSRALAKRERVGQCEDGRLFVMSEVIDGISLREALSTRGVWAPKEVAQLLLTLCEGLEYLHRRGLCHGNLNPSLVYLSSSQGQTTLKLLDTGLILMRAPGLRPAPKVKLVRPEYMSPERILGQRATPSSDIYGVGVLGYEMLCGKPPFFSKEEEDTRRAHVDKTIPPFPAESVGLSDILRRCLSKQSEERWPTADALVDALQAFLATHQKKEGTQTVIAASAVKEVSNSATATSHNRQFVGNYELLKKIGEGAMGEVYFARNTKICREVALKVLKPEFSKDRALVQRFFNEAIAVSRIQNEHIVEVYDLVQESPDSGGRVFLVMELLHGATLRDLSGLKPFPISRAVFVVRQVAKALGAAHRQGIVHRDVKPDNIFIVRKGANHSYVKLLDFGVAKLLGAEDANKTVVGTAMGTPNYMAPEQTRGESVDARTDVYALGVVLYNLLSGSIPHQAPSISELLLAISTKPPTMLPPVSSGGEAIPTDLRNLVMRCLRKEPSKRPQSMEDLYELLRPFSPDPTNVPISTVSNASRSAHGVKVSLPIVRKLVWVATALLSLMVGAASTWLLWPQKRHAAPTMVVQEPKVLAPVWVPPLAEPPKPKTLPPPAAPAQPAATEISVEVSPAKVKSEGAKLPLPVAAPKAPPPTSKALLRAITNAASGSEKVTPAPEESEE